MIDFTTLAFGNYSTSEVDTGFTYIDGKPIYRKTQNFTVPSQTNATEQTVLLTSYGFPQVDMIIHGQGVLRATTADTQDGSMYMPNGYSAARGGMSLMTWGPGNPYLYFLGNGSTRRIKLTLWYTKP